MPDIIVPKTYHPTQQHRRLLETRAFGEAYLFHIKQRRYLAANYERVHGTNWTRRFVWKRHTCSVLTVG